MKIIVKNKDEKEKAFNYCKVLKAFEPELKIYSIESDNRFLRYENIMVQFFFANDKEKEDLIKQALRHNADVIIIDE